MSDIIRESQIEAYLCKRVRELGGLCYKFVSPGRSGVPDRIVVYSGSVYFVEVKSPTGVLTALQERELLRLTEQGVIAIAVNSTELIDEFIRTIRVD